LHRYTRFCVPGLRGAKQQQNLKSTKFKPDREIRRGCQIVVEKDMVSLFLYVLAHIVLVTVNVSNGH